MLLLEENDPEFNDDWINEVALAVETCFAETEKYFLDRLGDPESSVSSNSDDPHTVSNSRRFVEFWQHANQQFSTRGEPYENPDIYVTFHRKKMTNDFFSNLYQLQKM